MSLIILEFAVEDIVYMYLSYSLAYAFSYHRFHSKILLINFYELKALHEDLLDSSNLLLIKAVILRRNYCNSALHSFSPTISRYLYTNEKNINDEILEPREQSKTEDRNI